MKARIEGRYLMVDTDDILGALGADGRAALIETLACQDSIIEHVAAQIVDGMTESGSFAGVTYCPEPCTALDKARRRHAESAGEAAKKEIVRLERIAVDAEARLEEARRAQHDTEAQLSDCRAALRRATQADF